MTDVLTARVRVFAPDEFVRPAGWPEDVGIAVLQVADEPEIFPVHQKESPAAILARIRALTGRDLRDAAVFPPVEGHPPCDLPFTAVAKLRAGIEGFLSRTPDAVEEAADFSVNFGFAADEGLDLSALVAGAPARPDEAAPAPQEAAKLPGYAPYDPRHPPYARTSPAILWRCPTGELVIVTDPDAEPVRVQAGDVLVREDGMGLALRRGGFGGDGGLPGYLVLPADCLGFDPPEAGAEVLIMARENHYLVTPVPQWTQGVRPEEAAPPPVATPPAGPQPRASRHALPLGLAAALCVAVGLFAFILLGGEAIEIERTAGPLPTLRAELFD